MKLNEFREGQDVYIVKLNQGPSAIPVVIECNIEAVGRKYVTLTNGDRYEANDDYLRESKDWGERAYLFPTLDQVKDFIEKKELVVKLSRLNYAFFNKCSLDALRKVSVLLNI